jgi:gamma-glutamyltranspeptidase/glutathione hydrolase/leukotriene-C4 hydrolase
MKSNPLHFQIGSEEDELTSIDFDEEPVGRIGAYRKDRVKAFWSDNPRVSTALLIFAVVVFPLLVSTTYLAGQVDSLRGDSGNAAATEATPVSMEGPFDRFEVTSATGGVVSTDHEECSTLGAHILKKGGNAMDAAIAAALCVGVLSPASSGIGGGCFILHYNAATKESDFIDAREVAPAAATPDMYKNDTTASQDGAKAIAVLGELKGLHLAWEKFGSALDPSSPVKWYDLVRPSAVMASEWSIGHYLAHVLENEWDLINSSPDYADLAALYTRPDGSMKRAGDKVQQPQLHMTLNRVAVDGPSFIYATEAQTLANEIIAKGGIITKEDISSYEPTERTPITTTVLGAKYLGAPPPSSGGGAIATILKFMGGFDDVPMPAQSKMNDLYTHRLVEGMKHAFGLRMNLGDPDFVDVHEVMAAMVNDTYIDGLRGHCSDTDVLPQKWYGGKFGGFQEDMTVDNGDNAMRKMRGSVLPTDHGTTHISVTDSLGNAVAITSTINTYFGSKIMSPSLGFVLNNQMDDFSQPGQDNYFGLAASEANYIAPGKKPLSSMSPSILVDVSTGQERVWMVGGASGGPRIITATAQVLLNVLGRGMTLLAAESSPRVHHQLSPNFVDVENRTIAWGTADPLVFRNAPALSESLLARQQSVRQYNASFGVAQFVEVALSSTGGATGVSDPRKDGRPKGV